VAIDLDELSIDVARHQDAGAGIEYIHGDFLSYDFEPASFDVIVSVAALHHMETTSALERMRQLLRPGGKLAIIGLARSRYPVDLPIDLAATLVHRVCRPGRAAGSTLPRRCGHRRRPTPECAALL
jgi:2-polyprenyl-3-methyl-5-hydroxy-6-metoxy-1,4-benzoquinol methylase